MKKCAKCDTEYADAYDSCPTCAKSGSTPAAPTAKNTVVGCLVLLVLMVVMAIFLSTCDSGSDTPAAVDDPAMAQRANAAFVAKGVDSLVYEVTATSDGTVDVTLSQTKDAIGGAQGMTKVYDVAGGAASIVFAADSAVKKVIVSDGDRSMIDVYEGP